MKRGFFSFSDKLCSNVYKFYAQVLMTSAHVSVTATEEPIVIVHKINLPSPL